MRDLIKIDDINIFGNADKLKVFVTKILKTDSEVKISYNNLGKKIKKEVKLNLTNYKKRVVGDKIYCSIKQEELLSEKLKKIKGLRKLAWTTNIPERTLYLYRNKEHKIPLDRYKKIERCLDILDSKKI